MIKIMNPSECCGCTACFSTCPQQAISMNVDEKGFLYPSVNFKKCIDCHLCEKVCQFNKQKDNNSSVSQLKAYATKHLSKEVLNASTSGGMFTALSDYILENCGSVFGAAFDDSFRVHHIRAVSADGRDKMRGSKYVQSDMGNIFSQVKSDLLDGKKVLFSGTPCQVDGLKAYLKGNIEGLYTCDLICHGTPSPKVWDEHVKFISKRNRSNLLKYYFRPKDWSWHVHNEKAVFNNGKVYCSTGYSNMFRGLYYSGLIMRPSCYRCPYSSLNRCADITIADCRGIDKILPNINSNEGVSLVIVNTQKGTNLFSFVADKIESFSININDVLQPPLQHPCKVNQKSDEFWHVLNKSGYATAIHKMFGRFYNLKYNIKKLLK